MPVSRWLKRHPHLALVVLLWLMSVPVKLIAAQNMVFDMDFVPVVARGEAFFTGGAFPVYGTLSSVAAYNMPMLVWLHLPARLFTTNPYHVMLWTLLAFNAVSTLYIYGAGAACFRPGVGVIAAALFAFSETGITSSYTAWAQLLLPGFFAMTLYYLVRWQQTGRGRHMALTGIMALAAFMTHFAAVMLFPAILGWILVARPRWSWRGLAIGAGVGALLVAPYLLFQTQRDFVDIRAFLTRQNPIPAEIRQAAEVKGWQTTTSPLNQQLSGMTPTAPETTSSPFSASRLERAVAFVLAIPGHLRVVFPETMVSFVEFPALQGMNLVLALAFLFGIVMATRRTFIAYRQSTGRRLYRLHSAFTTTEAGYVLLILGWMIVICLGLIATRATPDAQSTYYMGLLTPQCLLVAYTLGLLLDTAWRWRTALVVLLVALYISAASAERLARVATHDATQYMPMNAWLYRSMEAATDFIAADWGERTNAPIIAYDILPEMGNQWWILAWHTVDPLYRFGAGYDLLLQANHGLHNANQNVDGMADQPDYILVYTPGLARYDLTLYSHRQFGALHILKPR
jgi:hypothetical protein